jgi:hypothetical protein
MLGTMESSEALRVEKFDREKDILMENRRIEGLLGGRDIPYAARPTHQNT